MSYYKIYQLAFSSQNGAILIKICRYAALARNEKKEHRKYTIVIFS